MEAEVLVPKNDLVVGEDQTKVAGWRESAHGRDSGLKLLRVVLDRHHVQTSAEGTTNIPPRAKATDENPLARPGVVGQDGLRKPVRLLMDVDGLTGGGILGQDTAAWADDLVVALDGVFVQVELSTETRVRAFVRHQENLDGRGTPVHGASDVLVRLVPVEGLHIDVTLLRLN